MNILLFIVFFFFHLIEKKSHHVSPTNLSHGETMLKDHLHWRRLCDNAGDSDSHYLVALATLGIGT